jgi:hypothetical protein
VTVFIPGKSPGGRRVLKTIDFCPQVPKLSQSFAPESYFSHCQAEEERKDERRRRRRRIIVVSWVFQHLEVCLLEESML